MKHIVAFFTALFILAGCATLSQFNDLRPSQQAQVLSEAFGATLSELVKLRDAGVLTVEHYDRVKTLVQNVAAAEAAMHEAVAAGEPEGAVERMRQALRALQTFLETRDDEHSQSPSTGEQSREYRQRSGACGIPCTG